MSEAFAGVAAIFKTIKEGANAIREAKNLELYERMLAVYGDVMELVEKNRELVADGLNKPYYILYNQEKKSEVPADIRGLQRFGYKKVDSGENSLVIQLGEHLVKPLTHPRRVFDRLSPQNKLKKFTYAMGVLSLMRDHKNVRVGDLKQVPKYRLRKRDRDEAFNALLDAETAAEQEYLWPVGVMKNQVCGKELNSLEEVESGMVHSAQNVYTEYLDLSRGA